MIGDGLLDVGFLRLPIENRKEIEVTTIHREPFVAIVPSMHSLSAKNEIHLRELKGNPFVMYARDPEGAPNSRRDADNHLSCRFRRLTLPSDTRD